MTLRQAAQRALKEMDDHMYRADTHEFYEAKEALRAALAEPEQEPVALPCCGYANASAVKWNPHNQVVQCHNCGQIYTAPTPRKPLTDEEMRECAQAMNAEPLAEGWPELIKFARAIERAHGIGEQHD